MPLKTKLTAELSAHSFDNLSAQLTELGKSFPELNRVFLQESVEWMKARAIFHIWNTVGKTGYKPTGHLAESLKTEIADNVGILRNVAKYAAFVEYGTGVTGAKTPHELAADLGWIYDAGQHGEKGWFYYDEQGKRHWTKGLEAHRYMYNTLLDYLYFGGKDECMQKAIAKVLGV